MIDFAEARRRMVQQQIVRRGAGHPGVVAAMGEVPREAFVPEDLADLAYADRALPIPAGQTISQPYVVALMLNALAPVPEDRALEVGAGSGYAAAVLSRIVRSVHAIERHPALAATAARRLAALGCSNVTVRAGDGTLGWPEAAPFDAILVSAGGPRVPEALRGQLAPGGRLVIPVGSDPREQALLRVTRTADGFREDELGPVSFVPLVGAEGWSEQPGG